MNVVRSSAGKPIAEAAALLGLTADTRERLRNLLVATIVAIALFMPGMLHPIDQLIWTIQSRLVDHQPSRDIVFVSAPVDLANVDTPQRRQELADALIELDRQGVGRVYLDIPIAQPSRSADADKALASAIRELGPRAILVDHIDNIGIGGEKYVRTSDAIGGDAKRVVSERQTNWAGFTWERSYSHNIGRETFLSLSASAGGINDPRPGIFQIDYSIPIDEIPNAELSYLSSGAVSASLTGRTVIIGEDSGKDIVQQRVPGRFSVPYTYVEIYAAESLKAGRTAIISGLPTIIIFAIMLAAALIWSGNRKSRRVAYWAFAFAPIGTILIVAWIGLRMELSYCVALLIVFAAARSRARWKNRLATTDSETGLPKLRALENATGSDIHARGHLVVARVHGYEHVIKTLPRSDRTQYIIKLVDRLRASDAGLTVYAEGHHLAWHSQEDDAPALVEHLEGLRAMFASPISVAGSSIDVGISFGVARLDGDPASRLAAAVAASEESSEALQPIKIAESNSRFDELWDISLRARIDEAMAAGEIYCVYQPKIDTRTGSMTGVEALVRWQDPARGFIPPIHFIAQCEKAGRMEALTQYVFEHACAAGRLMHFRGRSVSMAVNISATLLSDMRIVGIVRNVLQASGFDPRFLILEVTETSRIGNLATAETVLNELRGLGARISMDDFGVGETNFETLFELPFDEVKIDRLFIANMAKSVKAKAIVTSLVDMGRGARIGIVAEGAEDIETVKMLTEIGCTHVQGYVLARPMSLENLLEFNVLPESGVQKA